MKTVIVKYGIGYGKHEIDIEVEDDAPPEEIEEQARDAVMDRLWWTTE